MIQIGKRADNRGRDGSHVEDDRSSGQGRSSIHIRGGGGDFQAPPTKLSAVGAGALSTPIDVRPRKI